MPVLTETDLKVLARIFVNARLQHRMTDAEYDRTAVVLDGARRRLREMANVPVLG